MQTFLPVADFAESAKLLDQKRLGKQRSEARQILKALRVGGGWRTHTAVRMWEGYELALIQYGNIIIAEWVLRGLRNDMELMPTGIPPRMIKMPPWLGHEPFHASHRSNLLRKNPEHYSRFGWLEGPDLPYYWPSREDPHDWL